MAEQQEPIELQNDQTEPVVLERKRGKQIRRENPNWDGWVNYGHPNHLFNETLVAAPNPNVTHGDLDEQTVEAIQRAQRMRNFVENEPLVTKYLHRGVRYFRYYFSEGRKVVKQVTFGAALFALFAVVPIIAAVRISHHHMEDVYQTRNDIDSDYWTIVSEREG